MMMGRPTMRIIMGEGGGGLWGEDKWDNTIQVGCHQI